MHMSSPMPLAAQVFMAADPTARKRPRAKTPCQQDDEQEGTGMWTTAEHMRFLEGVAKYPKGPWKYVADHVQTRTVRQIRTHAQKYREKHARHLRGLRVKASPRRSIDDPVAVVVASACDVDPLPYSCSPTQLDECMAFLLDAFADTF